MARGPILSPENIEGVTSGMRSAAKTRYRRALGSSGASFGQRLLEGFAGRVLGDVLDPVADSISNFVNKPFDKNRKAWMMHEDQEAIKRMGKEVYQSSSALDARLLASQERGIEEREFWNSEQERRVEQALLDKIRRGGLLNDAGKIITLKDLGGIDGMAFQHLKRSIAKEEADATWDAFQTWKREKQDLTNEADYNRHIVEHNPYSGNVVGFLGNRLRALTGTDLELEAAEAIKASKKYIDVEEVQDALANLSRGSGLDALNRALEKEDLRSRLAQLAPENFEIIKMDREIVDKVLRKGDKGWTQETDGQKVRQEGWGMTTRNPLTGEMSYVFNADTIAPIRQSNEMIVSNLPNALTLSKNLNPNYRKFLEQDKIDIFGDAEINLASPVQHANEQGFIQKYSTYLSRIATYASRADAYEETYAEGEQEALSKVNEDMAAKFATLARNPQDPDSIKELKKAQESARIIYAFQKKVLTFDPVTGVITPLHHTVAEKPGEFIGDPSVSEGQRQAALRRFNDWQTQTPRPDSYYKAMAEEVDAKTETGTFDTSAAKAYQQRAEEAAVERLRRNSILSKPEVTDEIRSGADTTDAPSLEEAVGDTISPDKYNPNITNVLNPKTGKPVSIRKYEERIGSDTFGEKFDLRAPPGSITALKRNIELGDAGLTADDGKKANAWYKDNKRNIAALIAQEEYNNIFKEEGLLGLYKIFNKDVELAEIDTTEMNIKLESLRAQQEQMAAGA